MTTFRIFKQSQTETLYLKPVREGSALESVPVVPRGEIEVTTDSLVVHQLVVTAVDGGKKS